MSKKRCILSAITICLLFFMGLVPIESLFKKQANASEGKPIELSLNLVFPSTHPRWEGRMKVWVDNMEKATGGRIKIVPHFAASLAPFKEAYNAAATGLADMTEAFIPMSPGRFPLSTVTEITPIGKSTSKPSRMTWDLYQAFPEIQKEFPEVKVLVLKTFAAYRLLTKKPVRKLEDLKGMKIASDSPWAVKRLNKLGATGVAMSFGEIFLALQKGVIDGVTSPETAGIGRRFFDHTKYAIDVNLAGYYPLIVAMNKTKWDSLPNDIKEQIDSVCGAKAADFFDGVSIGSEEKARARSVKEFGVEYIPLSAGELARWAEIDKEVQFEWVEKMEAKNLPGRKVLNKLNGLLDSYQ
jgi:TRAP-type C4-dicarboxylate transport system substrate-binding protein